MFWKQTVLTPRQLGTRDASGFLMLVFTNLQCAITQILFLEIKVLKKRNPTNFLDFESNMYTCNNLLSDLVSHTEMCVVYM